MNAAAEPDDVPDGEEDAIIKRALHRQPHLGERALFDLMNCLEVTDDLVRANRTPPPFASRIWAQVTGRAAKQRWLIDSNLATSSRLVVDWLKDADRRQIKTDLCLAEVIEFACDLREALSDTELQLRVEIEALESRWQDSFSWLSTQVKELQAQSAIEPQFAEMNDPRVPYPPIVKWLLTVDALLWGPMGSYLRGAADNASKVAVLRQLGRRLQRQIVDDLDVVGPDTLLSSVELLRGVDSVAEGTERDLVLYLLAPHDEDGGILRGARESIADGPAAALQIDGFPRTATPRGFAFGLIRDSLRKWKANDEIWIYEAERHGD